MQLTLLLTVMVSTLTLAQTAGPQPVLIYTYDPAASAPTSLLSAISAAGAPAKALDVSTGVNTATNLVPPYPTTATVGPATIPIATGGNVYSSASPAEVLSTNVRAPYVTTGTVDVSAATSSAGAPAAKSSGNRMVVVGSAIGAGLFGFVVLGAAMV